MTALTERDYLALCIWDEARGETDAGKRAVAEVVLNRTAQKYSSDGTIRGTVLRPNQFSGFWFDMVDGRYQKVCHDIAAAEMRAIAKFATAKASKAWTACLAAADAALDPEHPRVLPAGAVLYLNPAIIPHLPAWANPAKALATIGHHTFYEA